MEKYIQIVNNNKIQNNITISEGEAIQLDSIPGESIRQAIKSGMSIYITESMYKSVIAEYYKTFIKKDHSHPKRHTIEAATKPPSSNDSGDTPAFLNNNLSRVKTQGQIFLDAIEKLKEPSKDIMSDSEPDNIKYRCIEVARDKVAEAVFWAEKGV